MVRAPWAATKPQGTWKGEEGSDPPSAYEMPREEDRGPHCLAGQCRKIGKESNRSNRGRGTREGGSGLRSLPLPHPGIIR